MLQRVMAKVLAGEETKSKGVSADTMLKGMDKKLDNFSTLVQPLPESRPRTPFDGPGGENLSPARSFTPRQMLRVLPQMIPMVLGMLQTSGMYDGKFVSR